MNVTDRLGEIFTQCFDGKHTIEEIGEKIQDLIVLIASNQISMGGE